MKYYIKKFNTGNSIYKIPSWYIDFLKKLETFVPKAYLDKKPGSNKNTYSVGYGSQKIRGRATRADDVITEEEASKELENYIYENLPKILKVHPNFYNYPEQAQAVIMDIVYRGGISALENSVGFNNAYKQAIEDEYISPNELKVLGKEMGYNPKGSIYGANGRKSARMLMLANMYKPEYNALINEKRMPNPQDTYEEMDKIVERTKTNPHQNFVQRLNLENRKTIPDWLNPDYYATHKLGWYFDPKANKDVVVPLVQELPTSFLGIPTGTEMVDFTDPRINKGKNQFNLAIESAILNNDTLQVNPGMGEYYTTLYKHFYSKFNIGGIIKNNKQKVNLIATVFENGKKQGTIKLPKNITDDQAAGRKPIYSKNNYNYYMNGDGSVTKKLKLYD